MLKKTAIILLTVAISLNATKTLTQKEKAKLSYLSEKLILQPYHKDKFAELASFIKEKNCSIPKKTSEALLLFALNTTDTDLLKENKELFNTKPFPTYKQLLIREKLGMSTDSIIKTMEEKLYKPRSQKEKIFQAIYELFHKNPSSAKSIAASEKKIFNKTSRSRGKATKVSSKNTLLATLANIGAFTSREDKDSFRFFKKSFSAISATYNVSEMLYPYQMYLFLKTYQEPAKAAQYLRIVEENTPYTGISNEIFSTMIQAAKEYTNLHKWRDAWAETKEAIEYGLNLDPKTHYKEIILLKRNLRYVGIEYVKSLINANSLDMAREIYMETNRVIKSSSVELKNNFKN